MATCTVHTALTLSPAGDIASWNPGCASLFGRQAADAIGRPFASLLAPPQAGPSAVGAISNGSGQYVQAARPDGSKVGAELFLMALIDDADNDAGSIAWLMSEPEQSESALVGRMPINTVIDFLPGTFYMLRPDGSFALWNKALEAVAAMSPEEMAVAKAPDMYELTERHHIAAAIDDVFTNNAQVVVEATYRNKHGQTTPFLLCGARITCRGNAYLCGMGLDISQRREQEQRLRLRERALHAVSSGLVITRCDGHDNPIEYANPAFERITGYPLDTVIGRDARFMAAPGLDEEQRAELRLAIKERRELHVVFRNRRLNGDIFWNDLTITPVSDGRGKVTHFIGVIIDVTASRQRTAHLEHEVNHDALTGLANRTLLWDRLDQALHMAQRNKTMVATVLIDLNGFKQINDTFGHEAGDSVLVVVAKRLQAAVRDSDTVARLSGDEFVLVLVNQPSLRFTMRMLERLRSNLTRPVMVDHTEIPVAGSMGVSMFPHDGSCGLDLLRAADAAMYHAKASKSDPMHFFSPDMKSTSEARQKMEQDLQEALENDALFLVYQPKICLQSGRIRGIEAFLRWRHPTLGVLLPASFLPDAEENGMIIPIGKYVLEHACSFIKRLNTARADPLPVSVNISLREFARPQFSAELATILARCGVVPALLELELREQGLNQNQNLAVEVISQLRDLGVQRSVDAFGDGVCDLNFLQKLPLSHFKLAKRAIYQISQDHRGGSVAKALIDIGHDLGIDVIAKGVETQLQMDFLKANGCDQMQGLYFSEPLTESALRDLLLANN
ncbi:MAG TPA: EAL domain-containing protein [Telluria sp.]|jgi:diguanylate cyclase (GGDEF)-like protein/PAS domain S-box-containing protein